MDEKNFKNVNWNNIEQQNAMIDVRNDSDVMYQDTFKTEQLDEEDQNDRPSYN